MSRIFETDYSEGATLDGKWVKLISRHNGMFFSITVSIRNDGRKTLTVQQTCPHFIEGMREAHANDLCLYLKRHAPCFNSEWRWKIKDGNRVALNRPGQPRPNSRIDYSDLPIGTPNAASIIHALLIVHGMHGDGLQSAEHACKEFIEKYV